MIKIAPLAFCRFAHKSSFTLLLFLYSFSAYALDFSLPQEGSDVVGKTQMTTIEKGDNFSTIGRRYNVGYYELIEANPGISPDTPQMGSEIVIPTQYILPKTYREDIVVNLAEMRIYYYPKNSQEVHTYPIAIGREGWETPEGTQRITELRKDPTWYVPKTVREARAKDGVFFPDKVLPGPENPLGKFAIRMNYSTFLIHGTNDSSTIGRRETAGCLRMFPEDVKDLFYKVKVGMKVHVINEPYKVGMKDNKLYLEAHEPILDDDLNYGDDLTPMMDKVTKINQDTRLEIDWNKAMAIAAEKSGVPALIEEN